MKLVPFGENERKNVLQSNDTPATPVLATDVIFDVGERSKLATTLMLVGFEGFTLHLR